jgi:hypothetical protein
MIGGMATDRSEPIAIACTLATADDVEERVQDWHTVLARAVERSETETGVRLRFDTDATTAADLARLAALEVGCCAWIDFGLTVSSSGTTLVVQAPPGGKDALLSLFGMPT